MAAFDQVSLIFDNYEMLYYPKFDTSNHRYIPMIRNLDKDPFGVLTDARK